MITNKNKWLLSVMDLVTKFLNLVDFSLISKLMTSLINILNTYLSTGINQKLNINFYTERE